MCGINGFNFQNKNQIKLMNDSIKHRGPNNSDIYISDNLSLGHVRLSIIDLSSKASQPMFYNKNKGSIINDKKYCFDSSFVSIVFNGEIYNYLEIKAELIEHGYNFKTDSDTEVILASYLYYGEKCVEKFNGMWSFCIHDRKRDILFLSRDRLGQKPLYYYQKGNIFIFSSELKGILTHKKLKINKPKNISLKSLRLYFSLGFIPSPLSIFKDVYKLSANTNLIYDLKKNRLKKKYKYFDISKTNTINNKQVLIEKTKQLIDDAVRLRLRSDVKLGAFLSGGLDSSSIVSNISNSSNFYDLNTFSIGFEGKYDETKYINLVKEKFKTIHRHKYFDFKDFDNLIKIHSKTFDEPFADYSAFPTLEVSKLASKYVTVVLSGDGGDEIFGGYSNYIQGLIIDIICLIPINLRTLFLKIFSLSKQKIPKKLSKYLRISIEGKEKFYTYIFDDYCHYSSKEFNIWSAKSLRYCLEKCNNSLSESLRVNDLLFKTLPDNYLTKVDRSSMAYSIEIRSPFLDYRLANFSQTIPKHFKYNFNDFKILLKFIFRKTLPKKIISRSKKGFVPPIDDWLIKNKFEENLSVIKKIDNQIYNFFIKSKNMNDKNFNTYRFRLFVFNNWFKSWVVNE